MNLRLTVLALAILVAAFWESPIQDNDSSGMGTDSFVVTSFSDAKEIQPRFERVMLDSNGHFLYSSARRVGLSHDLCLRAVIVGIAEDNVKLETRNMKLQQRLGEVRRTKNLEDSKFAESSFNR